MIEMLFVQILLPNHLLAKLISCTDKVEKIRKKEIVLEENMKTL